MVCSKLHMQCNHVSVPCSESWSSFTMSITPERLSCQMRGSARGFPSVCNSLNRLVELTFRLFHFLCKESSNEFRGYWNYETIRSMKRREKISRIRLRRPRWLSWWKLTNGFPLDLGRTRNDIICSQHPLWSLTTSADTLWLHWPSFTCSNV